MQFVASGPDIPETLLQAHEEGRVVFFCGAGISFPANLPGFEALARQLFDAVGTRPNAMEDSAFQAKRIDVAIDLLEHRVPDGRESVRGHLSRLLTPKNYRKKATAATHAALLDLAANRDGSMRIVTTNFDRIFQHEIRRTKLRIESYSAPLLPIPKATRWNGVVYLHGLLDERPTNASLNRLVLSSGDFGLAYLTERWAARFVSELFRNFVVCFVGYSIDDPIVRYMMDALAADKMLGESVSDAYALGSFSDGNEDVARNDWAAKGVVPILYKCLPGNDHSLLHTTLWAWAGIYRDGVQGKERLVDTYAGLEPRGSTREDDFVGRLLWALLDRKGQPAKRFADFIPAPSISWLEALCEERFSRTDLSRIAADSEIAGKDRRRFSLLNRPLPGDSYARLSMLSSNENARWDVVIQHLARWLARNVNSPELLHFLCRDGFDPSSQLLRLIEEQLQRIGRLKKAKNTADLKRELSESPNGIADEAMTRLWRLLLRPSSPCIKRIVALPGRSSLGKVESPSVLLLGSR